MGHVVADRAVGDRQGENQETGLQPAGCGNGHGQNLSGFTSARIRYTLSATAAIRPMMLSALKTLDPLHDEGEDGEGGNGQHDVEDVGHLGLLVTRRLVDGPGGANPVVSAS